MHKRLVYIVAFLVLTGCETNQTPQSSANDQRPEVRAADDQDDARHLSFKIAAVHKKQKPSKEAPFFAKGGEWTFFECEGSSDPKMAFTVGVGSAGNAPSAWGRAVLIVKDRQAGAHFVESFAKAFGGKEPRPVKQRHVPGPLSINTAILGRSQSREKTGGFSGERDAWTTTKWFPEHDGLAGEVYFNYSLEDRQGEFSEKNADYADDLVAIFASAFRDGPRPERTPDDDPNITRIGPKIGQPRKLLSRLSHYSFSPKGRFAVYQDRETISALSPDQADGKPFEITRFDHSPWTWHIVDDDLNLLVQEGIPTTLGVKSSADPMRIWWVDGKNREKKLLRGPEKDLNLAEQPLSPDHRYVVLDQWQGNPRKGDRTKVLFILDHDSGKTSICKSDKRDLTVTGWRQTNGAPRLVAVTNRWQFDKKAPTDLYLVDPATGKLERQKNIDSRLEIDNPLSPDGKHRIHVGKDELLVTDVQGGTQRHFIFHEDDRRFIGPECIEWVSPRYLKFNGQRLALIDVTTMNMSFPVPADRAKFGSHSYRFSPDVRWVLYQGATNDDEGLFLAPVEEQMQ
jgi:hypothetical protein